MTSAAPAKFNFDLDMSSRGEPQRVLPEEEYAEALEAARQDGLSQGRAEGEKSEVARAAAALQMAAEKIAQQAAQMAAASDDFRKQARGEAILLAGVVGRKLAGHLMAREPAAEIDALIDDCLASLGDAPHLVIRCHPELADNVREAAEQRMATSGFSGRLIVMGEPEIALHDGRIEWVDGGLVRDTAAIEAEISVCIENYFNANGITTAGETEQ
jgi:flagellar assembly protein FliH